MCPYMPVTADWRTQQFSFENECEVQEKEEDVQRLKTLTDYLSMSGTPARLDSWGIQHLR